GCQRFRACPDIAQAIAGARARNRAKVVTYLLQSVIARHRDKWADLLLRTAVWMREAPPELDLCWRELAIVAKALADGRDMADRINARYRSAEPRSPCQRRAHVISQSIVVAKGLSANSVYND